MAIMVIWFISTLKQYLHHINTTPQWNRACNFDRNPISGIFCSSYAMQGQGSSIYIYAVFCSFFLGAFSFFLHFVVFCSTIILYALFLLSCNILQFIFVCRILWLFFCTDTIPPHPLQRQWKWWQPPIPATRCTAIANGGAPDISLLPWFPLFLLLNALSIWSV